MPDGAATILSMAVDDNYLGTLAFQLGEILRAGGSTVTTAESCTGGWVAKALTDVPGSSAWFGYGLVTYSNAAKTSLLGVDPQTLRTRGAVSAAVVCQMATGALRVAGADFSVAVSGVAGPDGGTDDKPVGTVWFAWARRAGSANDSQLCGFQCEHLAGDRAQIRRQSVAIALEQLIALASET